MVIECGTRDEGEYISCVFYKYMQHSPAQRSATRLVPIRCGTLIWSESSTSQHFPGELRVRVRCNILKVKLLLTSDMAA